MRRTLVFCLALLVSHAAYAGDEDVKRAAGAAAGVFAGIYIHELGHATVFHAAGAQDVRIRVPGSHCTLLCGETQARWTDTPGRTVVKANSIAGFLASNLAAEVLLHHEDSARSGFGQGLIATNLYSNVSHVVGYYTKVRGRGGYRGNDIDQYELAGGNPHLLSAGLLAYSVYALRRMHKKEIPVMFVKMRF